MKALSNILGVARYERKMLLRTTKFRVLGGMGVAIPVIVGGGLAVAEARGVDFESVSGMGAYIPFYIYTYLQTVVIAFIVGDFRAADERAGISEVVASRPISTAELVIGKYLGVVGALATLSVAVLVLTLLIQAAKISITGTPFAIRPYVTYLLLMNLPGLVYMSAVTFFLGSLLRRQSAVTLVSIAYALSVLFFLGRRYGGIYDFGSFFAPIFYSDLLGLGDISRIIEIRVFYIVLALFFFGLSIERYPRLSQSLRWTWFGRGMAVFGLVSAAGLYLYMEAQDASQIAYLESNLNHQELYANRSIPEVTHYDMDLTLMDGPVPLKATATLHLKNTNDSAIDTLILNLNPGLAIYSCTSENGQALSWTRRHSVTEVQVVIPPDSTIRVTLAYGGEIDLDGFDLLRQEDQKRLRKRKFPGTQGDLTAWIRPESVLLPPRSRWYPVAGVDYGYEFEKPVSFSTADIVVSSPAGMKIITQGRPMGSQDLGKMKKVTWKVERPVPSFSLNGGLYEVYEAEIHGIDCAFYVHPSHKSQVAFFGDAKEQAVEALEQILDVMEQETGLPYPYPRLSLVEVPFHVQWYYEGWQETGGLAQPGVLMIEEDVLMRLGLRRRFKRMQRRQRQNDDPAKVKRDLLVSSLFSTFFAQEASRSGIYRSPVVQLWSFDKVFAGENYALLKRGMPLFMQKNLSGELQQSFYTGRRRFRGRRRRQSRTVGTSWDTLVTKMQSRSFADLNPVQEAGLYRAVVDAKAPPLFGMMQAVMGDEEFRSALGSYEKETRFEETDFSSFEKAIVSDSTESEEGKQLKRLMHDWLHSTHVPGYTLTKVKAYKVDDGWGMVVYQVIVRIRNGEPGRGFVQVKAMGSEDEATKGVEIEGGQEVEVGLILWERPSRVSVDPFFARNRRILMAPLRIPERPKEGSAKSYVRVVTAEEAPFSEIIVDNDDEGFSMPIRRVQRYLRPELKGDNWKERQIPFAFGRYETNYRWKHPGDGSQPAVWSTRLPHEGDYDVAYYFIPSRMRRRFRLASRFTLRVFHGSQIDTLELEAGELKGGWNLLGRYRFKGDEEVRVELMDLANGRLYADAVRWRFVDPDNPEEVYEEDVPSWSFGRNRGGGGGGRGGRGGGRHSGGW
jgi:ABC-type transport system involved in multi-copper enzyme maturation permease subunit